MSQDKKPYSEFGDRLKAIRLELGLKQTEMAEKIGISNSTYQYYERGERDAPFSIAKYLTTIGVNPHFLLTGGGPVFGESNIEDTVLYDHICIIQTFKNKTDAKEFNRILKRIEDMDERKFYEALGYIRNELKNIEKSKDDIGTEQKKAKLVGE